MGGNDGLIGGPLDLSTVAVPHQLKSFQRHRQVAVFSRDTNILHCPGKHQLQILYLEWKTRQINGQNPTTLTAEKLRSFYQRQQMARRRQCHALFNRLGTCILILLALDCERGLHLSALTSWALRVQKTASFLYTAAAISSTASPRLLSPATCLHTNMCQVQIRPALALDKLLQVRPSLIPTPLVAF